MRKIKNSKGFTLMEMLIVVAIIAVLVAIAIPTFTNSLEKAREATDAANIRAAYAEVAANYLTGNGDLSKNVDCAQKTAKWSGDETMKIGDQNVTANNLNGWTVTADKNTGALTITEKD